MSLVYLQSSQDLLDVLGTDDDLAYLGVLYDRASAEIVAYLAEHVLPANARLVHPTKHWFWTESPGHMVEICAPDNERAVEFIRLSTGRTPPEQLIPVRRTHVPWCS